MQFAEAACEEGLTRWPSCLGVPQFPPPQQHLTAAEPVLGWQTGTFAAAYARNRREGSALALDDALISGPLRELAERGEWQGTATELLHQLGELAGDEITDQREWPGDGKALTDALKRLAPDLRASGIEWQHLPRTGNARPHTIRRTGGATVTTVNTDTPRTVRDDGPYLDAADDRHDDGATVTASRTRGDGHDGRDGHPPASELVRSADDHLIDLVRDRYENGTLGGAVELVSGVRVVDPELAVKRGLAELNDAGWRAEVARVQLARYGRALLAGASDA